MYLFDNQLVNKTIRVFTRHVKCLIHAKNRFGLSPHFAL